MKSKNTTTFLLLLVLGLSVIFDTITARRCCCRPRRRKRCRCRVVCVPVPIIPPCLPCPPCPPCPEPPCTPCSYPPSCCSSTGLGVVPFDPSGGAFATGIVDPISAGPIQLGTGLTDAGFIPTRVAGTGIGSPEFGIDPSHGQLPLGPTQLGTSSSSYGSGHAGPPATIPHQTGTIGSQVQVEPYSGGSFHGSGASHLSTASGHHGYDSGHSRLQTNGAAFGVDNGSGRSRFQPEERPLPTHQSHGRPHIDPNPEVPMPPYGKPPVNGWASGLSESLPSPPDGHGSLPLDSSLQAAIASYDHKNGPGIQSPPRESFRPVRPSGYSADPMQPNRVFRDPRRRKSTYRDRVISGMRSGNLAQVNQRERARLSKQLRRSRS